MAEEKEDERKIAATLTTLPAVTAVSEVVLTGSQVEQISLETASSGQATIRRLTEDGAADLFTFYMEGLSAQSRDYFPPYPLFNPTPSSAEELRRRICAWQQEDDWVFFLLYLGEKIGGCCLLKRYGTARPTSGLAVREDFQQQGLGVLLQTVINEQARLLGLKRLTITLAPDNLASLNVHRACGFVETGNSVPHFGFQNGVKTLDRYDTEMVRDFTINE